MFPADNNDYDGMHLTGKILCGKETNRNSISLQFFWFDCFIDLEASENQGSDSGMDAFLAMFDHLGDQEDAGAKYVFSFNRMRPSVYLHSSNILIDDHGLDLTVSMPPKNWIQDPSPIPTLASHMLTFWSMRSILSMSEISMLVCRKLLNPMVCWYPHGWTKSKTSPPNAARFTVFVVLRVIWAL